MLFYNYFTNRAVIQRAQHGIAGMHACMHACCLCSCRTHNSALLHARWHSAPRDLCKVVQKKYTDTSVFLLCPVSTRSWVGYARLLLVLLVLQDGTAVSGQLPTDMRSTLASDRWGYLDATSFAGVAKLAGRQRHRCRSRSAAALHDMRIDRLVPEVEQNLPKDSEETAAIALPPLERWGDAPELMSWCAAAVQLSVSRVVAHTTCCVL